MQIERGGDGWYLSVTGGTDGGDLESGRVPRPICRVPRVCGRRQEAAVGPSGEFILT